jgi:hypothetical protein
MTERLIISIGNWATIQAEGILAIGAILIATFAFGSLWLLIQVWSSKGPRSQ